MPRKRTRGEEGKTDQVFHPTQSRLMLKDTVAAMTRPPWLPMHPHSSRHISMGPGSLLRAGITFPDFSECARSKTRQAGLRWLLVLKEAGRRKRRWGSTITCCPSPVSNTAHSLCPTWALLTPPPSPCTPLHVTKTHVWAWKLVILQKSFCVAKQPLLLLPETDGISCICC